MSKSCCSHQHAAAPIKAVSKAATPEAGHSHTSHCCDNGAQASGVANPTRHDHQGQSGADGPGDEEPPEALAPPTQPTTTTTIIMSRGTPTRPPRPSRR